MQATSTIVIPVFNGEKFILETLESAAAQSRKPDRVVVLDNCSTDRTEKIVREFKGFPCEYIRNPRNLGLFGNCNRALEFASETKYLLILAADDLIRPELLKTLMDGLEPCAGLGLAYCTDERIDENGKHLSISGKNDGSIQEIPVDTFLERKAEIANQAFSGSLMKTNFQKPPCLFRLDMPILADVAFWADWGKHCSRILQVNQALCQYRWHGDNTTNVAMPGIDALILDEWRVMQLNEKLRKTSPGLVRRLKLKSLFAVRTGIKAKRIRQQKNLAYSRQIVNEGKRISGPLPWYLGQGVVELRDAIIYGLLRRPRHPKNVYS